MKKNSLYILIFIAFIFIISCGGGSSNNSSTNNFNESEENGTPVIDASKPLMEQLQKALSNLEPKSRFYGLKIKKISHPSKFVGTWTMWDNFRGDKSTFNQDGTCSDEFFYFKTGETKKSNCLQWYHVTLNDDTSLLLFLYPTYFSIVSYEWSDKDNIYFYYYGGNGHLATRASSTPLAKNVEERFLLGTWIQKNSDANIFWTFGANHKFLVKSYLTEGNKLVVDRKGTWELDKTKLNFTIEGQIKDDDFLLKRSLPPKEMVLNFLYGIEKLGYESFTRYSEPLMISNDPYVGKFQAHSTYNSYDAMSLNVSKTSKNNYLVDIFWNNRSFPKNSAIKKDGLLYVSTKFGTLIFKAVINGIQKINILEDNSFNFPERMLRVSQDPTVKERGIVGRWVESEHYSIPKRYRYFTFLENGHFFHQNGDYEAKMPRKGTYKKVGTKLYLKGVCGTAEKVEKIVLNEAHFAPTSYSGQSFVKIKDSKTTSSLWYALKAYEADYKKESIKLIPDPKHQGKFLFSKDMVYSNLGFLSMHFQPNGEMLIYYSYQIPIYQDYYIEVSNKEVEKIVLLQSSTNPYNSVRNPKALKFYDARQTICSNGKMELGLQK